MCWHTETEPKKVSKKKKKVKDMKLKKKGEIIAQYSGPVCQKVE
jgi:hypothetical protein